MFRLAKKTYYLSTDGASYNNGKKYKPENPTIGGYNFSIYAPDKVLLEERSVAELEWTNQRGELRAVLDGLCHILHISNACDDADNITVVSDSKYVIDGASLYLPKWANNGWKTAAGKPIENMIDWQELHDVLKTFKKKRVELRFQHVYGHGKKINKEKPMSETEQFYRQINEYSNDRAMEVVEQKKVSLNLQ